MTPVAADMSRPARVPMSALDALKMSRISGNMAGQGLIIFLPPGLDSCIPPVILMPSHANQSEKHHNNTTALQGALLSPASGKGAAKLHPSQDSPMPRAAGRLLCAQLGLHCLPCAQPPHQPPLQQSATGLQRSWTTRKCWTDSTGVSNPQHDRSKVQRLLGNPC